MADSVRLKFLGVRAIHPSPGLQQQTTGGNTSCIELDDGRDLIFVNAGFGLSTYGDSLSTERKKNRGKFSCAILFSDFLWDSTIGLASFGPMHSKASVIKIFTGTSIENATSGLNDATSHSFSPFDGLASFPAKTTVQRVTNLVEYGSWSIAAHVTPNALTHDGATVWRIKHRSGFDAGIVMLCDKREERVAQVAHFLKGCQTLICAATTSPDMDHWDANRTGFSEALTLAMATGAKSLHLTQFHPEMPDHALQNELVKLQSTLNTLTAPTKLENLRIHLASELEQIEPMIMSQYRKSS